jgi:hypothetical protein
MEACNRKRIELPDVKNILSECALMKNKFTTACDFLENIDLSEENDDIVKSEKRCFEDFLPEPK